MAKFETFKTAIIGCGMISEMYMGNLCNFFKITEVVGCSDLIPERSKKRADQFNIKQMTNEEILSNPDIKIVVNLTDPKSHYEVTKAAFNAGKHVYCEKMMAVTLAEGEELYALAKQKKLAYTMAPDSFLGAAVQTARWVIDSGMIGMPVMMNGYCQRSYLLDRGDDEIRMIHKEGGGIPFDMGGYFIHSFINFFGPIEKVSGFTRNINENRKFLNPHNPRYGDDYREPSINTMVTSMKFKSGMLGTFIITSESVNAIHKIEVTGTEGTLFIGDPSAFSCNVSVKKPKNPEPLVIPYTHAFTEQPFRGIGVVDMAYAVKNNRKPRADAEIGLQAFELVHKVWESTTTGLTYTLKHVPERPAAMPATILSSQCAEGTMDHA